MHVKNIHLTHFRSASDLIIWLDPRLNVFIGANGAGKTTVLDAVSLMLSWASARIRSSHARGNSIRETDINNDESFAGIDLQCESKPIMGSEVGWHLGQIKKGRNADVPMDDKWLATTNMAVLNDWASELRDEISAGKEYCDIPLFVYYRVTRAVLDIPLRIRNRHVFALLEAHDGALSGGTHFRSFFEWYRAREDLENENLRPTNGSMVDKTDFSEDPQLRAVRNAIYSFLPYFSDISIRRSPLRMEVKKNGNVIRIDQMSDGEKCLFAMVGDLARRLSIANPTLDDPKLGTGIVLIDEIEMHLHPAWQRCIVPDLQRTFPNCQFIVTTHSPQVIGEVDARNVRKLSVNAAEGLQCRTPAQTLGLDSNDILEELMETPSRRKDVADELSVIFDLVDRDEFTEAKYRISELKKRLNGSIPELLRAESLMVMLAPEEDAPA